MDDLSFILGLMRENTDALGFIPSSSIKHQYVANQRHIIQLDNRGRRVGYVLHGKPTAGGLLTIAQVVIDIDHRDNGFGNLVVRELIERARFADCRGIKLRCADDLSANAFWLTQGFEAVNTLRIANRRQRAINVYICDLWPTLFNAA